MSPPFSDELEALELRGWQALCGPDGAAFYGDVMAEDGVMVFPGMLLDKAAALRAIASSESWSSFDLEDVRVSEIAPDVGMVVYRASAQRGDATPYRAMMTSVYARRPDGWRLVLHQQSPIP